MHHPDPLAAYRAHDADGFIIPALANEQAARIADEIVALLGDQVTPRAARIAGRQFVNWTAETDYGFGGIDGEGLARWALYAWIESKTAAALQVAA